jgi:hypothetical protein
MRLQANVYCTDGACLILFQAWAGVKYFLFSIDLEDIRFRMDDGRKYAERVPAMVEQYLEFLNRHNAKCTWFTVGDVARAYPSIIKMLVDEGHEIGCHSDLHIPLTRMDKQSFSKVADEKQSFSLGSSGSSGSSDFVFSNYTDKFDLNKQEKFYENEIVKYYKHLKLLLCKKSSVMCLFTRIQFMHNLQLLEHNVIGIGSYTFSSHISHLMVLSKCVILLFITYLIISYKFEILHCSP